MLQAGEPPPNPGQSNLFTRPLRLLTPAERGMVRAALKSRPEAFELRLERVRAQQPSEP